MLKITTQVRTEIGKQLGPLRNSGMLPAVAYGPKLKSISLSLDAKEFRKAFQEAGYSNLISLEVDGKQKQALIKEVQMHPVSREYTHISFYVVDLDKEIEAEVPLEVIGIAPAVKNNLGFLEIPNNNLTVKCLPSKLPAQITIDISGLEQVHDAITVKDIKLNDGVNIVTGEQGEDMRIVFISPPQKEIKEDEVAVAEEASESAEATTVAAE